MRKVLIVTGLALTAHAVQAQTLTPQQMYQIIGQEHVAALMAQTQAQIAQARLKDVEDKMAESQKPKLAPAGIVTPATPTTEH